MILCRHGAAAPRIWAIYALTISARNILAFMKILWAPHADREIHVADRHDLRDYFASLRSRSIVAALSWREPVMAQMSAS